MTDPNYWLALIAAYLAGFLTVLSAYEFEIRKNTTKAVVMLIVTFGCVCLLYYCAGFVVVMP